MGSNSNLLIITGYLQLSLIMAKCRKLGKSFKANQIYYCHIGYRLTCSTTCQGLLDNCCLEGLGTFHYLGVRTQESGVRDVLKYLMCTQSGLNWGHGKTNSFHHFLLPPFVFHFTHIINYYKCTYLQV